MERLRNCRVKRYPDGTTELVAASAPFGGGEIRREPPRYDGDADPFAPPRRKTLAEQEVDYELLERDAIQDEDGSEARARAERAARASRERAQRRARVAVRDLGLCNDWEYFVTLTLDPARINRYDPAEVVRHLNHWLDNRVRRDGLCYVLVPEHHKDGAIHFHGFFNGALAAVDSGHKDRGGHTVYNLPAWGWGFSTAIRLYGERAAAVGYCCKYISKQQEKIGGRWYYSGGALRRPEVSWSDVDFDALLREEGAEPFQIEALPWARFLWLRRSPLQEYCIGDFPGADAAPGFSGRRGRFTFFGLSTAAASPWAPGPRGGTGEKMTPGKRGGMEAFHDDGISAGL